jgi:hypothetical protein
MAALAETPALAPTELADLPANALRLFPSLRDRLPASRRP